MTAYWPALAGGIAIGLSAAFLLLMNGRIAGISGIVGRLVGGSETAINAAFVAGLLLGPAVYFASTGRLPAVNVEVSWPLVVVSGLLVGVGTRMGSGCTSGHGILGLARLSKRSAVATLVFFVMGVAMATAFGSLA